ncbi:hypothetical protein [Brevibacillus brevis]|uniref:hypothetical protein n=1 Tax=Brevibacillus brevis TaxID=1393 RepID=UPI0007D89F71|nr:hypothetical protein [Brevibacillus brevis]
MNKQQLFKAVIEQLQSSEWRVVFDPSSWEAKIVNLEGNELDLKTLGFILEELKDYFKRREENELREHRKTPLDEFTKKRLGVRDYVLLKDELRGNLRNIFEAYHDNNGIFTMDNYTVFLENNLKYYDSGFTAHLTPFDAEKIINSLQNFVDLHKENS